MTSKNVIFYHQLDLPFIFSPLIILVNWSTLAFVFQHFLWDREEDLLKQTHLK